MGEFLQCGYKVYGSKEQISIVDKNTNTLVIWCTPEKLENTIHQVYTHIVHTKDQEISMTIFVADFKI
jgi:hypothetical protein